MVTALPGIDDEDPFQQLADAEAAQENAPEAVEAERKRCAGHVQAAIDKAALRGLTEASPVVRILAAIKHSIEVG
jgi:hypothetical protein